jgi:hypothetical protein
MVALNLSHNIVRPIAEELNGSALDQSLSLSHDITPAGGTPKADPLKLPLHLSLRYDTRFIGWPGRPDPNFTILKLVPMDDATSDFLSFRRIHKRL